MRPGAKSLLRSAALAVDASSATSSSAAIVPERDAEEDGGRIVRSRRNDDASVGSAWNRRRLPVQARATEDLRRARDGMADVRRIDV